MTKRGKGSRTKDAPKAPTASGVRPDAARSAKTLIVALMLGVGYKFDGGSVVGAWRYTDYDMKSDARLKDISFSGPMIGMTFQW